MPYVKVALDVPLPTLFDYSFDAATENARDLAGRRVVVSFGRRDLAGLVLATTDSAGVDPARIKPLRHVLRDVPPLLPRWLDLLRFCASYYQYPLGAAALSALPGGLKSAKPIDPLLTERLVWHGAVPEFGKREHVKAALVARLVEAADSPAPLYGCELAGASPKALAYVAAWQADGHVVQQQGALRQGVQSHGAAPAVAAPLKLGDAPALNDEQSAALAPINAALDGAGVYRAHLLHGVTGSEIGRAHV